ncbi:MAG: hypothetical protein JZU49_02975 [Sulfuricurvum sp.]|nr:hypothetical protein [Sulfuricurvum sp.]
MHYLQNILSITTIFILTGCAPQQITLQNKFDADLTKRVYEKDGNNTINGNAFLRQNGGGVITCAGSKVQLIPYTIFSRERILAIFGNTEGGFAPPYKSNIQFSDNPTEYFQFRKTEYCDSNGNFTFPNVGDGKYYINTYVFWNVGNVINGGSLAKSISVKNGEVIKVIMSQ